jgi:hypothetical protein
MVRQGDRTPSEQIEGPPPADASFEEEWKRKKAA